RWAKARGLPRCDGHRRGASSVKNVLAAAKKIGIRYLSLYAFSAENFSRPKAEVDFLMNLMEMFLRRYRKQLLANGIRFRTIGDISALPQYLRSAMEKLTRETADFTDFHLTIAANYGARDEIIRAIGNFFSDNGSDTSSLRWSGFRKYLDTADLPDPDLIIRTSGEQRLSNFLLLQSAYSELYFTETLWPDFGEKEFSCAIDDYRHRERRMGNVDDEAST
ncbi:MAG: di-trans,poly-cis-decaprenylcistransferase, partial [Puniceicoccales bacterium]|nr:di-trans,poly-cis-decaprenylcistransferase [Puniceicoccales bacterium]